jgi:hypothetical protein
MYNSDCAQFYNTKTHFILWLTAVDPFVEMDNGLLNWGDNVTGRAIFVLCGQ